MNTRYQITEGRLLESEDPGNTVWFDLHSPSREEVIAVEKHLKIKLPTLEDMEEIEVSSRLYEEDGAVFMTVQLQASTEEGNTRMGPVAFILTTEKLVTIRYHDPRSIAIFVERAKRHTFAGEDGEPVFLGLVETIVDRLADIIERAGRNLLPISQGIFRNPVPKAKGTRDYQLYLETIGRTGDLISDILDSLMTLDRAVGYYLQHFVHQNDKEVKQTRVKTITHDLHSIGDHAAILSAKITLLLDATLGMIGIEQSAIIKIFSVAAVIFLPPMVVASLYGMNFEFMPELGWHLGYPFAIGLMILSAVLPYGFFKRKGWL
ncbi:MAG: magnesium transporter CorA family protein [Opitutales bacterium]|nr:magnesium transporter CorA family protein [Opitutales bacterium]